VRAALGATGALAMTLALGLSGWGSPLVPTGAIATLGTQVAGADDLIAAAALVATAVGIGPVLLAAVWAVLAVTAPAVLAAQGRALVTASVLWLGSGTVATLMLGVVLGGTLIAPLETVMGAGAAGIVIFIRSRRPAMASAAPATGN
jgi:hypothetical protein